MNSCRCMHCDTYKVKLNAGSPFESVKVKVHQNATADKEPQRFADAAIENRIINRLKCCIGLFNHIHYGR